MALSPGEKLGPYEIASRIGSGGMGDVYRARDPRLSRDVAIKVVRERFNDRFEREARAIAALNHPHICQVYDVGPDYLVMELVDGRPLQGPLPLPQALKFAIQIAGALEAAHGKGIAHRDLKPANILVAKTGVKLLDFGLAKSTAAPALTSDETVTISVTARNEIVGTLQYMSPEQLQPGVREVDTRTDIFSFGLLLYEVLTGKRAFDGPSQASVIAAILERPAPGIASVAPPALDRLLQRCLAKDPADRWQSTADLRAELEWIASAPAESAPAPRRSKRLQWLLLAAVAVALIADAGAIWIGRHPVPAAPRMRFILDNPPADGWVGASFSPDGTKLALATEKGLLVRALDSLDTQPIASGVAGRFYMAWSPDGRSMLYFDAESHELRKLASNGGTAQTVATGLRNSRGFAWAKDGTILFSTGGPLMRVSAIGGNPTPVTTDAAWYPTILPDGRHYLYLSGGGGISEEAIYLASLDSKEVRKIALANSKAEYSPSGHLLFLTGTALMALPFDASSWKVTGEAVPVASDVRLIPVSRGASFSVSSNGAIIYQSGAVPPTSLTWLDRSGKATGVFDDAHFYEDIQISPDGNFVAATRLDLKTLRTKLWTTDLKRGVTGLLTPEPDSVGYPSWSPDGKHIAYGTLTREIYIRDTTGSGNREHVASAGAHSSWSPDGGTLSVVREDGTRLDFVPSAGDHKPSNYLQGHAAQASFSPDGHWMVYASDESGTYQIFVQSIPAGHGKWQISTNGGTEPIWRQDGKELFYLSADDHIVSVPVKTGASFEAGTPKPLFHVNVVSGQLPYVRRKYSVTPDGERFLVNLRQEDRSQTILLQNWLAPAR